MNIRVKFFNIQLLMDFEIEEQTLHPYTSQTVLPHHSHFQLSRNTLYPPRYSVRVYTAFSTDPTISSVVP